MFSCALLASCSQLFHSNIVDPSSSAVCEQLLVKCVTLFVFRLLNGGPHPSVGRSSFERDMWWPVRKYRDSLLCIHSVGITHCSITAWQHIFCCQSFTVTMLMTGWPLTDCPAAIWPVSELLWTLLFAVGLLVTMFVGNCLPDYG